MINFITTKPEIFDIKVTKTYHIKRLKNDYVYVINRTDITKNKGKLY